MVRDCYCGLWRGVGRVFSPGGVTLPLFTAFSSPCVTLLLFAHPQGGDGDHINGDILWISLCNDVNNLGSLLLALYYP